MMIFRVMVVSIALGLSSCVDPLLIRAIRESREKEKEQVSGYVDEVDIGSMQRIVLFEGDGTMYELDAEGEDLLRQHEDYWVVVVGVKAYAKGIASSRALFFVDLVSSTRPNFIR